MVTLANDGGGSGENLPNAERGFENGSRMTLGRALELDCLVGATVVAGRRGLDHEVTRVNVMEVPDILPWVQPDELLLTTGYALRHDLGYLTELLPQLKAHGLAGLAIKLRRYIGELPQEMLDEADRLDFPLVTLPESAAFDDIIYGVLSSVFNPRMSMLERAEAMLRSLVDVVLRGGDLEEVCRRLVDHGYPVAVVTTPEGEVIAQAGDDQALAAARALPCFDRAGRFKVAEELPGLRRGRAGSGRGDDPTRLVARISAGALDHGRLIVFAPRPLSPVDLHLIERSAEAAALVITKNRAVVAVESKYRADFLRNALDGTAGPAELVVRHAKSLGWELGGSVVLVIAELDPADGDPVAVDQQLRQQERLAAAWAQWMRVRSPGAAVVGRGHEVISILRAVAPSAAGDAAAPEKPAQEKPAREEGDKGDPARSPEALARLVREVAAGVRRSGAKLPAFSIGISRVVSSVDDLPQAYEQARTAVSVGRLVQGGQALVPFDALGVFRLLSLIGDSRELDAFVAETLGELADERSADAADLRETLAALLDNNLNVAETARQLHFHYNTLRYRIGKLEQLLGPFTTDPNARLSLALALRVVQMRRA